MAKEKLEGYVWYSAGSNESGPLLAERLGFRSGNKTPIFERFNIVVGWGCKPGTKYASGKLAKLVER